MAKILSKPKNERTIAEMFDNIALNYDFLNALLSLKQDHRWRKKLINEIPYCKNGNFLDIATGTGDIVTQAYAAKKGYKTYCGIDISKNMLQLAEKKANKKSQNIKFSLGSAENIPFEDNSVDCLTISFGLRNVINTEKALQEFQRVLKPGAKLLILDFFSPPNRIVSKIFLFYFEKILPKIGGIFSKQDAYEYLPKSLTFFYSSKKLIESLEKLNFKKNKIQSFIFQTCILKSFTLCE